MGAVEHVNPPDLPPPSGFSHASRAARSAPVLVHTGGQIGCGLDGVVVAPGDIAAQFRLALENLVRALAACGAAPEDVVKLTYYVVDVPAYRAAMRPIGEAYREVFGRMFPATTLLGVAELFDPQALVEIDAVAVIESAPAG